MLVFTAHSPGKCLPREGGLLLFLFQPWHLSRNPGFEARLGTILSHKLTTNPDCNKEKDFILYTATLHSKFHLSFALQISPA